MYFCKRTPQKLNWLRYMPDSSCELKRLPRSAQLLIVAGDETIFFND